MGHAISALLTRAEVSVEKAAAFGLPVIQLPQHISMLPLTPEYLDRWSEVLGISGFKSERPLLNCNVAHHIAIQLVGEEPFAIIETDYFGGAGDQAAVVYAAESLLMSPTVAARGPINNALRLLGVSATQGRDEFDTVELGKYRSFEDLRELA
jgi:hypothetical protein